MECLWKLCNRVWRGKDWIEEWNDGIIVSIRKKRDGERMEDYRGATLTTLCIKCTRWCWERD